MRSLATRGSATELSLALEDAIAILKAAGYDLILVETPGIGQGDTAIARYVDLAVYIMTAEFGAPSQLEKSICLISLIWSPSTNLITRLRWTL
jgi:isobutyryl-CoA mutase